MAATLSDDIITNILCCLGVEDLLRCRSVSKAWCSLIDSRDFINLHLTHSLKTYTNIFLIIRCAYLFSVDFDSLKTAKKLNHPFDPSDEGNGTEILGSCNGLLVLFNEYGEFALWNRSTRRSQIIPACEIDYPPRFSVLIDFTVYGFGFDSFSNDYKFVRVVLFSDNSGFASEVRVYSLRTSCWRRIKDLDFYLKYKRGFGIFCNNALHWVASEDRDCSKCFILALDLGTEESCLVPLPDCLDTGFHMNVNTFGGFLSLTANYWEVHVVDIWIMKEYGVKESWIKLLSMKQPGVEPGFEFVAPLAYSKTGDRVLLNQDDKRFVWYDLKSKSVEYVKIEGAPTRSFDVEMFVESLVPLGGCISVADKIKKKHRNPRKKKNNKRDGFLSQGFHLVL